MDINTLYYDFIIKTKQISIDKIDLKGVRLTYGLLEYFYINSNKFAIINLIDVEAGSDPKNHNNCDIHINFQKKDLTLIIYLDSIMKNVTLENYLKDLIKSVFINFDVKTIISYDEEDDFLYVQ